VRCEPNLRHCIHGLDADLIMLALATHEVRFSICREVVLDRKAKEKQKEAIAAGQVVGPAKLHFLQIWILREYLYKEFALGDYSTVPGGFDLERVIDDFVFLCFFVGNDFLPHIPALEIRDGAIDMLIFAYKQLMPKLCGYLTDAGRVHLPRTELILREVASYESEIFERHRKREEGRERAQAARTAAAGGQVAEGAFGSLYPPRDATQRSLYESIRAFAAAPPDGTLSPLQLSPNLSGFHKASVHLYCTLLGCASHSDADRGITVTRRPAAKEAKACASSRPEPAMTGEAHLDFATRLNLRLETKEAEAAQQVDEVRYGERDWKERYYACKLRMPKIRSDSRRAVVASYIEGLCWVLLYYYQGVQDWGWFYPFHYAPCASDLIDLQAFQGGHFQMGAAFTPLEQLMAVFPPASGHALPSAYRALMVQPDSAIIDFYPIDFRDDLNGKKFSWQAVALLPFIDASRLRAALEPLRSTLTPHELKRDTFGDTLLFSSTEEAFGQMCVRLCSNDGTAAHDRLKLNATTDGSRSFGGSVHRAAQLRSVKQPLLPPPGSDALKLAAVHPCRAMGVAYEAPPYRPHVPRLLPGAVLPEPVLDRHDQPQYSRDADQATRGMAARSRGNGVGNMAARRMVHASLSLPNQRRQGR